MRRFVVLLQEVAVVVAHLHGAWTLWRERDLIETRILPTDKLGHAYPEATVAGMSVALAGFAATFALAAILRRLWMRVGVAVERVWLALPTLIFVAFSFGIGDDWTMRSRSPVVQSLSLAIWWSPGALTWVWLLVHPTLIVMCRSVPGATVSGRGSPEALPSAGTAFGEAPRKP